ncbi:MAG: hypothetical protein ACFFED_01440 [Candidatus Thorarchaeota archaeon]
MIRKITELSAKIAEDGKQDPEIAEKKKQAAMGQAPRFLIISPIHRSSQDLQLFRFGQGDAFHATRVRDHILPLPDASPFLFAGPAAYSKQFPEKTGVILTFDVEESGNVVRASIENAAAHPDLNDIPLLAFRVDYERGDARLVAHGFDRAYELENYILKRISRPEYVDDDTLVVICSDSRVTPPVTPNGVPMAIQTLGAHVPPFDESIEETVQLNDFFEEWLSKETVERRIIVVVHGNFEGEGPSCGAGLASLNTETVTGTFLRPVIETLERDALRFEDTKALSAEERVVSLGYATLENIKTYPSVMDAIRRGASHDEFMRVLKMDTVTNVVSPYEIEPL